MNASDRALLEQIAEDVAALRAAVERTRSGNQRADIGEHLRTIRAVVSDRVFSVSELLMHSTILEGAELRGAIIALVGSLNGRRLGRFLRGVEGQDIAGLRIERIGVDRLGVIWRLRVLRV